MNGRSLIFMALGLVLAGILVSGIIRWFGQLHLEVVEVVEYHQPPRSQEDVLEDDEIDDKKPLFDPSMADRRPLGQSLVNQSAAVIKLDVPAIKPDTEAGLLALYPAYKAAGAAGKNYGRAILPSVSMIDGKAKQFDDGLYAALDLAYYQGLRGRLIKPVELVRRLYDKVGKDNPAAPYLAAGLSLAGVQVEANEAAKSEWLRSFLAKEHRSKPIGFYTWNESLSECFRFMRFFQHQFSVADADIPRQLAIMFTRDPAFLDEYRKVLAFYRGLSNPTYCFTVADLAAAPVPEPFALNPEQNPRRVGWGIALFPPSTSREVTLFEKRSPEWWAPPTDLTDLARIIRSGKLDFKPKPDSGWFEYQTYALETLLVPERGGENQKLLLTRAYKKRMFEAFQVLIAKRRETHIRQTAVAETKADPGPQGVTPRLRVEPCPSYFLRTARSYAFLTNFLGSSVGKQTLQSLHGLWPGGKREANLYSELNRMRDLFYGLYLISADDIGLKSELTKAEAIGAEKCYRLAESWLSQWTDDRDLAADTRSAIPMLMDEQHDEAVFWVTLGVRLAKLDASYARPPCLKPATGEGAWKEPDSLVVSSSFLIPVEEFAEVKIPGLKTLTREELRAVCDREKTKDAIVAALRARR